MRARLALCALLLASLAQAQESRKYQTGQLLQMESLQCTVFEHPAAKETDTVFCREYVLRGDSVLFHLRATNPKRAVLLPVGKEVDYRIEEDRFFLHVAALGKKEQEYTVVSMEPVEKPEASVQTAKVNHLQ